MANTNPELKKFFSIADRVRKNLEVSDGDLKFYFSYAPQIDQQKIEEYLAADKNATREQTEAAVIEAGRMLQSDPVYREQISKMAYDQKGAKLSEDVANGINLVLAGSDIAQSINQIRQSKQALAKSKRPVRTAIPQRDAYLQQALRGAQESTLDAGRALAPAQAQIQDQYLSDIQGAKTASTGQAGTYGAYRQLAANRRNRSAMELAPIQDQIHAREQARYDNLLGMRQAETQQMFENQASLYPYDMYQYNKEQDGIAALGSVGHENLSNSLYNLGSQVASNVGNYYSDRKYRNLINQANAAGLNPDYIIQTRNKLEDYSGNYRPKYGRQFQEQAFIG